MARHNNLDLALMQKDVNEEFPQLWGIRQLEKQVLLVSYSHIERNLLSQKLAGLQCHWSHDWLGQCKFEWRCRVL
jgi:hypothetical protein